MKVDVILVSLRLIMTTKIKIRSGVISLMEINWSKFFSMNNNIIKMMMYLINCMRSIFSQIKFSQSPGIYDLLFHQQDFFANAANLNRSQFTKVSFLFLTLFFYNDERFFDFLKVNKGFYFYLHKKPSPGINRTDHLPDP